MTTITTADTIIRLKRRDRLGRQHVVEFGIPDVSRNLIFEVAHCRADGTLPGIADAGGNAPLLAAALDLRRAEDRLAELCRIPEPTHANPWVGCKSLLAPEHRTLPPDVIEGMPACSATIHECCREAAHVAGALGRVVAFHFIDHEVVVRPGADPEALARGWWIAQYGKTPEQSRADR